MNSTAMQSVLVAPESHSCEEINELMQSVYSDLNKDVSYFVLFDISDH